MKISTSGIGPTVVFIHGFCENSTIWTPFRERLEQKYQVVLIDLPGHGGSPIESQEFTIDAIADKVHTSLKEQGNEKYFVIGHSLGGYVSLALAQNYADQVLGFGLFSSTTYPDTAEKKKARVKLQGFLEEHGVQVFMDSFVPNLFSPANRVKMHSEIAILKHIGSKVSINTIVAYSLAMKDRPDRTHVLADFSKPRFIVTGADDGAVPLEVSQKMMELVPTENTLLLDGVGHNGFVEAKAESLEFIELFLDRNIG